MHKETATNLIFGHAAALRGTRNPHVLYISSMCTLGFCVPCVLHQDPNVKFVAAPCGDFGTVK